MDDTNTATTRYQVTHAHGVTERAVDTLEEAIASVRSVYGPDCAIGHTGDIADGGERTLVWADDETAADDDETAADDDGSRAVATIQVCHREVA